MDRYILKCGLSALMIFGTAVYGVSEGAKFEPSDGKTILIIGQDSVTIENYISSTGIVPAGFMVYTSIKNLEGLESESPDYGSGINDADKLLSRYPGSYLQIGLCLVGELSNTYSGMLDGNIEKFARWLKKTSSPVFLRIGYECDGLHNSYDSGEYILAYRHIVDKLRKLGVDNTAFVWHVHAHKLNPDLDNWYPGNGYVDWIGISYFDQPEAMMDPVLAFAKLKHKPVMIAEGTPKGIGSGEGQISWETWYRNFFGFLERNGIKAVSYINSDWEKQNMWKTQDWKDARVEANDYVMKHWISEVSRDKYIKYTPILYGSNELSK